MLILLLAISGATADKGPSADQSYNAPIQNTQVIQLSYCIKTLIKSRKVTL